jgi:ABC-type branched-subunit amino acid transport system permease subunit
MADMQNARSRIVISVGLAAIAVVGLNMAARFLGYPTYADFGSGVAFLVGLIVFGWLFNVPRRAAR